jgi:hypothetical protein
MNLVREIRKFNKVCFYKRPSACMTNLPQRNRSNKLVDPTSNLELLVPLVYTTTLMLTRVQVDAAVDAS